MCKSKHQNNNGCFTLLSMLCSLLCIKIENNSKYSPSQHQEKVQPEKWKKKCYGYNHFKSNQGFTMIRTSSYLLFTRLTQVCKVNSLSFSILSFLFVRVSIVTLFVPMYSHANMTLFIHFQQLL